MELLHTARIRRQLTPKANRYFSSIVIFPSLPSTNAYLLAQPCAEGSVCLAEQQTAGRGRWGRVWESPYGCSVYLSVACTLANLSYAAALSLAAAIAVIDALQSLSITGLQLKWPNDIVYQQHKLAGVLLETAHYDETCLQVVVGIGLNVDMPADLPVQQPWIDLKRIGATTEFTRNVIVSHLLNALHQQIVAVKQHQLAQVQQRWPSVDALYGKQVAVQQGDTLLTGIARGIDAQGRLIVINGDNQLLISSGEVSQLRADGVLG